MCVEIRVGARGVWVPEWDLVPRRGWQVRKKGNYVQWVGRCKNGPRRGVRLHRFIVEILVGRRLESWEQVHHQDFDPLNNRPLNLLLLPGEFNPRSQLQDPFTGRFLSKGEWERRYGPGEPEWVGRVESGEEEEDKEW